MHWAVDALTCHFGVWKGCHGKQDTKQSLESFQIKLQKKVVLLMEHRRRRVMGI